MSDSLALPRTRARRRRRLPRPPKFTRGQKWTMAFFCVTGVHDLLAFVASGRAYQLAGAAAAAAIVQGVFLDALRPPFGGMTSYLTAFSLVPLAAVLWMLGL